MFCIHCGKNIPENSVVCPFCAAAQSMAKCEDFSAMIPKNTKALWAYYLGIASLICGMFLGIPALVLGIQAIKYARINPQAKGVIHAWVGIVLGALSIIFLFVWIGILLAMSAER